MNKYYISVNGREIRIDADSIKVLDEGYPYINLYEYQNDTLVLISQFIEWDYWYTNED